MYLARKYLQGQTHYVLRESYPADDGLRSRDLLELGPDPGRLIVYPGGNAYYFDPQIEEKLMDMGVGSPAEELDDLLWPFVDPRIRHAVEAFRRREHHVRRSRLKLKARPGPAPVFHVFDRRRLQYLKYGRIDRRRIARLPRALTAVLENKSRDEIEQQFLADESVLRSTEIKTYVYAVFDLQRHFPAILARNLPQGLDQQELDVRFIKDLCRLHRDPAFGAGLDFGHRLHPYLVRYAVMFFDYDFEDGSNAYLREVLRHFVHSHHDYRPPVPRPRVDLDTAAELFGVDRATLKRMDRRELSRLFRRRAQRVHPDKTGGNHEAFVRLVEAYQALRSRLRN